MVVVFGFCHDIGEIGHGTGLRRVLDVLQRWFVSISGKSVDASRRRRVTQSAGTRTSGDRSKRLGIVELCESHSHHQNGEVQAGTGLTQREKAGW